MAAFRGVELAKRLDSTPTESEIEDVTMPECPDIGPKIERGAKKYRVDEGAAEIEVGAQSVVVIAVVPIQAWGPQSERSCAYE